MLYTIFKANLNVNTAKKCYYLATAIKERNNYTFIAKNLSKDMLNYLKN